ncbi:hypothetical protein ZHAS_00015596 [Anopheles sinensis]|uniref:Uncharacterized protein n=1 Tax=Anopheles sinensis TaxID=74873 RepID=A0A084WAW0_ANOSI|nr:hypothetical protein ZHAS_00015596 [Anopheles sinensis]
MWSIAVVGPTELASIERTHCGPICPTKPNALGQGQAGASVQLVSSNCRAGSGKIWIRFSRQTPTHPGRGRGSIEGRPGIARALQTPNACQRMNTVCMAGTCLR